MGKRAEVDIARPVVEWLRAQHWTVYQEVSLGYGCRIVDIVATQGILAWAVEVKTSLSLEVIGQAREIRHECSFVSVAVPRPKRMHNKTSGRNYAEWCMRRDGIGMLYVSGDYVTDSIVPALNRKRRMRIEDRLVDAQQDWAQAGNANGDRWTPFQQTCRNVRRYVTEHPGVMIREVFEHAEHHYSTDATARACLLKWARVGKVKGVRCEQDGRRIRLYPTSTVQVSRIRGGAAED